MHHELRGGVYGNTQPHTTHRAGSQWVSAISEFDGTMIEFGGGRPGRAPERRHRGQERQARRGDADRCDKIGRRFQNLRATLVKTTQGGQPMAKLLLAFEVFGDDTAPVGAPSAVSVQLLAGDTPLAEQPMGALYLPYGVCWYDNQFAVNVDLETFAAADRVCVVAAADEVRMI